MAAAAAAMASVGIPFAVQFRMELADVVGRDIGHF